MKIPLFSSAPFLGRTRRSLLGPDGMPCVLWRPQALDCRVLIPPETCKGLTPIPPTLGFEPQTLASDVLCCCVMRLVVNIMILFVITSYHRIVYDIMSYHIICKYIVLDYSDISAPRPLGTVARPMGNTWAFLA